VTALADANTALAAAAKVVASEVKKATNATYTYLLMKGHLSCGWYICAASDGVLLSAKFTVTGSTVTALLCVVNGETDPTTCSFPGDTKHPYWWKFTGKRNGATAIITSAEGDSQYAWGTVTFAGTAPNSAVIKFTGADRCQRQNGTFGKEIDFGCK